MYPRQHRKIVPADVRSRRNRIIRFPIASIHAVSVPRQESEEVCSGLREESAMMAPNRQNRQTCVTDIAPTRTGVFEIRQNYQMRQHGSWLRVLPRKVGHGERNRQGNKTCRLPGRLKVCLWCVLSALSDV